MENLDLKEIKSTAKESLSGNIGTYIIAYIIMNVIVGVTSQFVVGYVLVGPFTLGMAMLTLKIVRKQSPEIADVFEGFKNFVNALITYLLYGFFLVAWMFLFVIPGIIKTYSYAMTFYILADNPEMTGTDAITKSKEMMNGYKMDLFKLQLSFIGWILLVIVTFGIAAFYVMPLLQTATATFYERIKGETTPAAQIDFSE